ncbi:DUF222 domain-containing protein [Gordonia sp. CPCC 205515]|uniref:HNH endonuclease signature motif containing protein n=1 Tax=Gordonia sp. CPCC 205515 TaxID=3140791 RepID=UPI003AF34E8F
MTVVSLDSVGGAKDSSEVAGASLFDDTPIGDLSDDQLRDRVVGYAGQLAAMTARFLQLLVAFDDRHGWSGEGIRSCAHWLSWRVGMSLRTAQDHVRVAHALAELPVLQEAFGQGRVTYSKVRALTRVATPDREQQLLNFALSATAEQVERLVKSMRDIDRGQGDGVTELIESSGRWEWKLDGSLRVSLRLSPLDGARFLAAVVRSEYERTRIAGDDDVPLNALHAPDENGEPKAPDAEAPDADLHEQRDLWRGVPTDIAPAVVAMADTLHTAVEIPETAPGAEILVHTHAKDWEDIDDQPIATDPHLDHGPVLADVEVEEASCAAVLREVRSNRKGAVLKYGRKRRVPTAALIRIVTMRDQGCAHPGCGRTRHLHVHHVVPWGQQGSTEPDNLILLCSTHHRALHRGEFGIKALGKQRFSFHRPSGSVIDIAPDTHAPGGWEPDQSIDPYAPAPVGGGRLKLGYATEVLYAIWALKADAADATEHTEEPIAA